MPNTQACADKDMCTRITAPLCQETAVSAVDFGLVEEVVVEVGAGVKDFDADEAPFFQSIAMNPVVPGGVGAWRVVRPGASGSPVRWM